MLKSVFNLFIFKKILWLVLVKVIVFSIPKTAHATSSLLLELGDKGKARATVVLEPQIEGQTQGTNSGNIPVSKTLVRILALPFELDSKHKISYPDNVEVSVLSNKNGYALISLLIPSREEINIRIDNAFNLINERIEDRVILKFETSYQFLQQHRSILNFSQTTISSYDITILLPQKYDPTQLSFQPRGDWKTNDIGKEYTLPASIFQNSSSPNEVFIAFPNPFDNQISQIKIIISVTVGFVLFLVQNSTIKRERGTTSLLIISVLTGLLFCFFIYSLQKIPRPIELVEWAVGPMIPITFTFCRCIWLIVATKKQVEIQGQITLDGKEKPYLRGELVIDGKPRKLKVDDNGRYKDWIWCGKNTRGIQIKANGDATKHEVSSKLYNINIQNPKQRIEDLNLESVQLPPSSSSTSIT